MEKRILTEQELFINLDNTQVLRGSLADVIWQGCKALQSEIEETENGTRKDYLVGCLYKGLFYHHLVLGCSEEDAKKYASEQAEEYGSIPLECVGLAEQGIREYLKYQKQ